MPKTAVILGATGLVGGEIVEQLAKRRSIATVIAITRRAVKFKSPKVANHVVNFDDLSAAAELFQGDLFFSALGTTRKQAGSIKAQRTVDLDYQLQAATLAAQNGVGHYLLVSSSAADSSSKSAYLKMKGELEDAVLELPFARISIFRPSLLLGNRARFRAGEALGAKILPAICSLPGLRRYRPITGEQVAIKMVEASLNSGPPRQSYSLNEIF